MATHPSRVWMVRGKKLFQATLLECNVNSRLWGSTNPPPLIGTSVQHSGSYWISAICAWQLYW